VCKEVMGGKKNYEMEKNRNGDPRRIGRGDEKHCKDCRERRRNQRGKTRKRRSKANWQQREKSNNNRWGGFGTASMRRMG